MHLTLGSQAASAGAATDGNGQKNKIYEWKETTKLLLKHCNVKAVREDCFAGSKQPKEFTSWIGEGQIWSFLFLEFLGVPILGLCEALGLHQTQGKIQELQD